jgi:hypothetical protein
MILNKDEQWLVWVPNSLEDQGNVTSVGGRDEPIPLASATELGVPPFFLESPTHFDVEAIENSQDGP